MKSRLHTVFLALALGGAGLSGPQVAAQQFSAGYEVLRVVDKASGRPIHLDVWYPTDGQLEKRHDYGISTGSVASGLPIAEGEFPLVLLSHGAMGAASNYSWLAEHLARRGYVVLGVSHFGESMVFGQDSVDPGSVARFGDRTRDLGFALDFFVSQSSYAGHVDSDRIGALGHSSGGASVVMLAGARFSAESLAAHCASAAAASDKGCWYPVGDPGRLRGQAPVPSKQPIRAVVAIDPAVGPGFDKSGLAHVTAPTLVIGSVENDFLPFAFHAARYAELLPHVESVALDSGEGHFVYLDECEVPIEVMGVPLCSDREGVDRSAVHARLVSIIEGFLAENLVAVSGKGPG